MGLVDTKLVGEYVPDYISKECLALARETQDIGTVFYEIIGVPSESWNNIIDFRDATTQKMVRQGVSIGGTCRLKSTIC